MKPTRIKIPKGCEYITFEQIGETIVTSFNEDKEFRIGDVCVDKKCGSTIIFIFGGYDGKSTKRYADVWGDGSRCVVFPIAKSYVEEMDFRHATESEKQVMFDSLAKIGKMWDAEKLEITNIKYVPKVGDCVKLDKGNIILYFFVENETAEYVNSKYMVVGDAIEFDNDYDKFGGYLKNSYNRIYTKITPKELQSEFNKLGYEYDFKTHTANKKRWRAKLGEYYWGIAAAIEPVRYREDNYSFDNKNYKIGNYFKTEEIAQKACDLFSESLKEFNNNLK